MLPFVLSVVFCSSPDNTQTFMVKDVQTITTWLTTSGIKIIGIVIGLVILSQISRWSVRWVERLIPEKDPLHAAEVKKR